MSFERFIQHGVYLKGWSPRTPDVYRRAYASYQQSLQAPTTVNSEVFTDPGKPSSVSKAQLEAWVIWMKRRGHSPTGINIYIRSMNSYLSWLKEEGLISERIKLKQLKHNPEPIKIFTEAEIKALLAVKPKRMTYLRTWIMVTLMLDTGCRIDEVLKLHKASIDFDNMLITVLGKGSKTRIIPFSIEMRKHLFRYCERAGDVVFGTRNGTYMTHRNAYRGIKQLFKKIGVEGKHVHPHNLRHTFACSYMKKGGNIFTLSRLLGHSAVTTTQTYLRGLQNRDLEHHSGAF